MMESAEVSITIWAETYRPDGRVYLVAKQNECSADLYDHSRSVNVLYSPFSEATPTTVTPYWTGGSQCGGNDRHSQAMPIGIELLRLQVQVLR